jgi:small subunit ribosomal protein S7
MSKTKAQHIPEGSSQWQEKFINCMMERGKKSVSRTIFGNAMRILRDQGVKSPEEVFEKAIKTVMPTTEVRARRVGGSVYQIPVEVKPKRQLALSIRWIIGSCRSKKGRSMAEKLAAELLEASKEQGAAFKKKEDVHRMASANKAFAHLARFS